MCTVCAGGCGCATVGLGDKGCEPMEAKMTASGQEPVTLWTTADVRRYLGWSRGRVYAALQQGLIPHRRNGARYVFVPDEVRRWVQMGCPKPRRVRNAWGQDVYVLGPVPV